MPEDSEIVKQLGANMAKMRKVQKLTQIELAEKTETSRRAIQSIEKGERWPRPATLLKISRELGVPVGKLFKGLE